MPSALLAGRAFLVTGSTDGIGLHTACKLASSGADVLVHGRDPARVDAAAECVAQAAAAAGAGGRTSAYVADLSSLAQVRQLARRVRADYPQLTTLVNNAGVFEGGKAVTEDGLELTWAVNVAAPFLLTALLLEGVRDRVVNVSSISAAGSIDWANLQQERGYSSHDAYSLSKLCSMLFTYELARRLAQAGSSVTANCLDPGTVDTKMLRAGWGSFGLRIHEANDEFNIATDPALDGVSGAYFISSRQRRSPEVSYDVAAQARLWALLEQQTGAVYAI